MTKNVEIEQLKLNIPPPALVTFDKSTQVDMPPTTGGTVKSGKFVAAPEDGKLFTVGTPEHLAFNVSLLFLIQSFCIC